MNIAITNSVSAGLFFFTTCALAQNTIPATPPEPANLAEAAGRYIAASEQLNVLKQTQCSYALKRSNPTYEMLSTNEILPAFNAQERQRLAKSLAEMKTDVVAQGKRTFDGMYVYYTKTEGQDNNTACGFITGAFISIRKMSFEAFNRAKIDWSYK